MSVRIDGYTIEKLTSSNWQVWSTDLESVLTLRGCVDALEAKKAAAKKSDAEALAAAKKADAETLAIIRLSVSTEDKLALKGCDTAAEAWIQLETRYKDISKASCLQLKRELASMEQLEGESIDDMAARARGIMEQLMAAGLECSEEDAVRAVLGGLPEAYDSLAISMLTSDDELTFGEVLPKLYVVERRQKKLVLDTYLVKGQGKGPKCWRCGNYGHVKANCTLKGEVGGDKGNGLHGHRRHLGKGDPPFSFLAGEENVFCF